MQLTLHRVVFIPTVHFITLLCYIYLPANAYASATALNADHSVDLVASLVMVVLLNFGVVGLNVLSGMMENPFGNDLCDFTVVTYLTETAKESRAILNYDAMADDSEGEDAYEEIAQAFLNGGVSASKPAAAGKRQVSDSGKLVV
jgi:hypothetical protein